jgi:CheY-like chemotaxis protein
VVLAADDDEDILELVAFRLGRSGYAVLQARDGEEALQLAAEHKPDLALLDVGMPKLDGLEVTRRRGAQAETSTIPIILLTAWVQVGRRARLRGRGDRLRAQAVQPDGARGAGAGRSALTVCASWR